MLTRIASATPFLVILPEPFLDDQPREKDARDIALRRVYGVARELMRGVDREEHLKRMQTQPDSRPSPALAPIITDLKVQLAVIETAYLAALQRIAQNSYLVGMAYGLAIATVMLTAFAIVTGVIGFTAG